ncbi:ParB/RepB/Spo0J family partition protein [Nocardia sp. NPDC050406]|uniref:ParB/RepB/Spo0J family partition protein n=1 Tax=Nocardia sp. NPDC050406 TaxID=3364318 RepID=UPI0037A4C05C
MSERNTARLGDRAETKWGASDTVVSEVISIPLHRLRTSESVRIAGANTPHIRTLSESTAALPPIVVHRQTMTVIDGVHRLHVARERGATAIDAVYFEGDHRAAFVFAVRANSTHGLPLTLADRKAAARRVMAYYPEWSNRRLAEVTGLSDKTIAVIRQRSGAENPHSPDHRVGRNGVAYPIDPAVGRTCAERFLRDNPDASAKETALAAGISITTAKEIRRAIRDRSSETSEAPVPPAEPPEDNTPVPDRLRAIRTLQSDPSVRFTDHGRKLLRMLELSPWTADDWQAMAAALPAHCGPLLARLAEHYSKNWADFAASMERTI